ncbi:hypothetical protein HID58_043631, partial [Brassica napus]
YTSTHIFDFIVLALLCFAVGSHFGRIESFKPLLPVRVKVICKGKIEVGSRFQKTELIVGDETIDPILKSNFYCFPNFIHVFCGLAHLKFSIDIICVEIPFLFTAYSNVLIKCVPYGTLAHNVTNIDGFSKVLFEPNDVPEIVAFRKM